MTYRRAGASTTTRPAREPERAPARSGQRPREAKLERSRIGSPIPYRPRPSLPCHRPRRHHAVRFAEAPCGVPPRRRVGHREAARCDRRRSGRHLEAPSRRHAVARADRQHSRRRVQRRHRLARDHQLRRAGGLDVSVVRPPRRLRDLADLAVVLGDDAAENAVRRVRVVGRAPRARPVGRHAAVRLAARETGAFPVLRERVRASLVATSAALTRRRLS